MDYTRSSIKDKHAVDLLVHNFTCTESPQRPIILKAAQELVHAVTSHSEWSNSSDVPTLIYVRSSNRLVEYRPMEIWTHTTPRAHTTLSLKNWGAPIDQEDDIFSLDELEDFDSTDISYLVAKTAAVSTMTTPLESTSKLHYNWDQHLHDAIPQPHIHPSSPTSAPRLVKLVPYRKMKPIPIDPSLGIVPLSPYARCAWLIPVRGGFPWAQCTPAVILQPICGAPAPPVGSEPIVWTYKALQSLWAFLLDVRSRGTAGTIGLSFQVSQDTKLTDHQSLNGASLSSSKVRNQETAESPATSLQDTMRRAHRIALLNVDHIKIYHEASNAMHLRNILHLWSYVAPPDTQSLVPGKIRVLKGARLALVDERSRGILLS